KLHRRLVADRAMRTNLIVVSTPSLAFCARLVEAQEPVCVQPCDQELAVEGFDEGVVGWLAWPAEVECHAFRIRPEIELLTDELGATVGADSSGIAELCRAVFKRLEDIPSTIAPTDADGRRQTRQRIDDG